MHLCNARGRGWEPKQATSREAVQMYHRAVQLYHRAVQLHHHEEVVLRDERWRLQSKIHSPLLGQTESVRYCGAPIFWVKQQEGATRGKALFGEGEAGSGPRGPASWREGGCPNFREQRSCWRRCSWPRSAPRPLQPPSGCRRASPPAASAAAGCQTAPCGSPRKPERLQ